jgi:peroxiredoxin
MSLLGKTAPEFTLFDGSRKPVTLSAFRGKSVVVAFIPASFTGVCEKELCKFRDSLSVLNEINADVLGISVDSPFANAAFGRKNEFGFPLLSDYTRKTVADYGVSHENFVDLPGYTAAKRSVFIVNPDGVIVYEWIAPTPQTEPNYDEIQKFLEG